MDTLLAVLTRDPPEYVALRAPGSPPARYGYREFVDTVWKTGNYFRRLGAHEGAVVAVTTDTSGAVPLSIFGAALNGATVRLSPPLEVDAKVLVAPGDRIADFRLPPGGQRVAHSAPVDDPAVHSFGEGVWSENPFFPRDRVFVGAAGFADRDRHLTQGELLERTSAVAEAIDPGDEVVLRTPLDDVRAFLAGIVAPLSTDATIRIGGQGGEAGEPGDVAVVSGNTEVPEPDAIRLDRV